MQNYSKQQNYSMQQAIAQINSGRMSARARGPTLRVAASHFSMSCLV